jgi:hypothetical protein
MRQRKQCNECFYIIRLKKKNPDKYYEDNPNYRKCKICGEWKVLDEYYFHNKEKGTRANQCKPCVRLKENEDSHKKRELELSESCGSERVKVKPNQYNDQYQKACTFSIMETLGYIFNEENGVWLKPGWKELNENGKVIFPKILSRRKVKGYQIVEYEGRKPVNFVTPEIYDKIFELRANGYTYENIGKILNIGHTTVFKYVNGKVPKWKNTLK